MGRWCLCTDLWGADLAGGDGPTYSEIAALAFKSCVGWPGLLLKLKSPAIKWQIWESDLFPGNGASGSTIARTNVWFWREGSFDVNKNFGTWGVSRGKVFDVIPFYSISSNHGQLWHSRSVIKWTPGGTWSGCLVAGSIYTTSRRAVRLKDSSTLGTIWALENAWVYLASIGFCWGSTRVPWSTSAIKRTERSILEGE